MEENITNKWFHIIFRITVIILFLVIIALIILSINRKLFSDKLEKHDPKSMSTRSKMAPIEVALNVYSENTGQYPETLEELINDPGLSGWAGPYLIKKQLYDPWGNPFVYELNYDDPNKYTIISYGRDGEPWGEGYDADIYND